MSFDMKKLIDELVLDEGLRLTAYRCTAGKATIGIGRNFEDVPFTKEESMAIFNKPSVPFKEALKTLAGRGITKDQAHMLLRNDINKCVKQLEKHEFWNSVKDNDSKSRAIINLCFNLGIQGLLSFKNTLKYIEEKDFEQAASNLEKSLWFKQVKGRAVRVIKNLYPEYGQPKPKPIPKIKVAIIEKDS
jgi:lysozyme